MSLEIQVSNRGAELTSIKFNNKEMLHDGRKYWDRTSPVLFPMVGRLRDNKTIINDKTYEIPQHGFAKDMQFELVQDTENAKVYMTESNEETLKMVAEMVPETKNPMKLMGYAMNLMNSIKLVINNDLEYSYKKIAK